MMSNNTNSHNTERYSLVARKQFGWIITCGNRMRKILRKPIMSAETGGKGFRKSCDVRECAGMLGERRRAFYVTVTTITSATSSSMTTTTTCHTDVSHPVCFFFGSHILNNVYLQICKASPELISTTTMTPGMRLERELVEYLDVVTVVFILVQ